MLKIPKYVDIPGNWKPINAPSVYDTQTNRWFSAGQTIPVNCAARFFRIYAFYLMPKSKFIVMMGKHPSIKSKRSWCPRCVCPLEHARFRQ